LLADAAVIKYVGNSNFLSRYDKLVWFIWVDLEGHISCTERKYHFLSSYD